MTRDVHRLRDLTPRARLVVALLALVLLLPPAIAFVNFLPDWRPAGDNAYIGLRAYDVGTSRTPAMGQPSTSGTYGGDEIDVRHLGALHFYLLAPPVRALGAATGMLLTTVLISGAIALLAVWVVFRQLGAVGGVVASAVLAAIMFTTGASSLANPISSNFSLYPLFLCSVLVWALLCGDDRLLPLAAVVVSFTVQVHLSVVPTIGVLAATAAISIVVVWWRAGLRRDADVRRRAGRLTLVSGGLALVLWLPLLVQEVFGNRGNLSGLFNYVGDVEGETLGMSSAMHKLAFVLGWPPLLGNTQLVGRDFLREPSVVAWSTAAAVLLVVTVAGCRWLRAGRRARGMLAVMVWLLTVAGLVSSGNVPRGWEEGRLAFSHWAWPLSFFVAMSLMFAVADLARYAADRIDWRPSALPVSGTFRITGLAVTLAAMVLVAAVNPLLDRRTNTIQGMSASYAREPYEALADQVRAHRDEIPDGPVLFVASGERLFEGSAPALALSLEEVGIRVAHPPRRLAYVADGRIVFDPDDVRSALVLRVNHPNSEPARIPGRRIASYDLWEDFDSDAYLELVGQLERSLTWAPGPELETLLASLDENGRAFVEEQLDRLRETAARRLLDGEVVEALLEYPLEEPHLDTKLLERLQESLEREDGLIVEDRSTAVSMEVYLVTSNVGLDTVLGWHTAS